MIKPDLDGPNPVAVLRSAISHTVASTLNAQLDTLAHTLGQNVTPGTDNVFHDSLIPPGYSLPGDEACGHRRRTIQAGSRLPFTKPSQEDLSKTKPFPMQAAEFFNELTLYDPLVAHAIVAPEGTLGTKYDAHLPHMQYQALGYLRHTYTNVSSALELINHGATANPRLPAHGAWQRLVRSLTQTRLASVITLMRTLTRPRAIRKRFPHMSTGSPPRARSYMAMHLAPSPTS